MLVSILPTLLVLLSAATSQAASFVSSNAHGHTKAFSHHSDRRGKTTTRISQHEPLEMMSGSEMLDSAGIWLATIDSDIDAIPTNEFATVFAGGITVMLGGVLSALVVGFILERGDLYANVVADSYAQGGDDEEFWKGLSDEERKKAEEMLQKIKESKEGGAAKTSTPADVPTTVVRSEEKTPDALSSSAPNPSSPKKEVDMFSDYAD